MARGSRSRLFLFLSLLLAILVACGTEGSPSATETDPTPEPTTPADEEAAEAPATTPEEASPAPTDEGTAGPPPGEEPVTLEVYIGFLQEDIIDLSQDFFDRVETASDGLITFEVVADPSSISPFESFDPLGRGVIDLAVSTTVYFIDQVPEPMIDAAVTSREAEIRERGALDIFNDLLEPHNVYMLGWLVSGDQFVLIGNQALESADLSGRNVRTFPAVNDFVLALNGSPVGMPFTDVYSALEQEVIDFAITPINSAVDERFYEVSDYVIYPPFNMVRNALLLNRDAWEGLSDWHRQVLDEAVREHEQYAWDVRTEQIAESEDVLFEHTEQIVLPESEGQKLIEAARDSTWDFMSEQSTNPEVVERLREMFDVE